MSNNQKVLDALLVKVDRAYKHILDFDELLLRFRNSGPYKVFSQDDPTAGERTFYLRILKEMPSEFPALIGDTIQNLRSALDHLAWHLVKSSPVTPKVRDKDIYFPIFESASEYSAKKMGKIQGMTEAAIDAIDRVEPYYRVDGTRIGHGVHIYWINALNSIDKHRSLIPVWVNPVGHTITRSKREEWSAVLKSAFPRGSENVMMAAPIVTGPVEDGSKLFSLPISEVYDDMRFKLHVAFGEPAGVCGKEILSTLTAMHKRVRSVIVSFDNEGLL